MAWVAVAGGAASALVGGLMSSGSSSAPSGGQASAYVPVNRPGFDQNFQNAYGQYQDANSGNQGYMTPYANWTFQNGFNNPWQQRFQNSAEEAGNTYGQQAGMATGGANSLYGAGNQLGQMAFDPRGDQYNMAKGQLQDNTRAAEYARGIGMTPYGAAVEGNVMGQFQNDWQNQQLQRANQGLQGMGRAYQGGAALGNVGGQMQLAAGQSPYDASNTITGNQNQAVGQYWQNQQPYMQGLQQLQSNSLGYLNNGNQAANQAFGQNMQRAGQAQQFGQAVSGPITQAIQGGFGNLFGPAQQSYNPSNYSTPGGGDTYYGVGQNWGI